MNSAILLHLLLSLLGANKSMRSLVMLDCGKDPKIGKRSSVFISAEFRLLISIVSPAGYARTLQLASQFNLTINLLNLSSVDNATKPLSLIFYHAQRLQQIGVVLNYDCKMAKELLHLVLFAGLILNLSTKYFRFIGF